jgi:predicted nucleic acid-binding protein
MWAQSLPTVAPPLLRIEVANAMRQAVRSSRLSPQVALEMLDQLEEMPLAWLPVRPAELRSLSRRTFEIANEHDLSATYDAHYIALAQGLGCDLWTADRRLMNALSGRLPFVRDLATFAD